MNPHFLDSKETSKMIPAWKSPCLKGWASRVVASMLAAVVLFVFTCTAEAWWNDKWQYRKRISFDTTATGADIKENLSEIPILLRLHTGNLNFPNVRDDGADIRFVGGYEPVRLKHHIEQFDPIDELALVWVKLPRLSAASTQDFVWMYYGNGSAVGGEDAGGTYDVNQVAVYHFDELEGNPQDKTAYGNHASAFAGGQGLASVIGRGITLNGAGDQMIVPASPSLDFASGLTFSAWIRIPGPMEDAYLFSMENEHEAFVIGIDGTKAYCRLTMGEDRTLTTEKIADLPLQTWLHLAVTAEPKGRVALYLGGIEMTWMELPDVLPKPEGDMAIGASIKGGHFFLGDLDEVQISNTARSSAWIRAAHSSQGPDGMLLTFGQEELGEVKGGLPTFYLGTVAKNITLDGWVIIGTLVLIAVASWMVFLSKGLFLYLTSKDNRAFVASFEGAPNLTTLEEEDGGFQYSSLYRVYQAGCEELKRWVGNPDGVEVLPREGVNALKAALEKGFVRETQRLHAWLVILTIAITGGPFLGLLGTVWGVMNTFAAMAEAGEANIMAIAPGVASALSTTVFGLIVAIPALFAYNFLSGKIKSITAEMGLFVDEFALKAEQVQRGDDETGSL
jgi:biopolymer transport protein ExbB